MKKILILYFLLLSLFSFSQNNNPLINLLTEDLQNLCKNNVSDIVYLQTSKGIYETEEDLWFKGYLLDGQNFTPSERSKILFVQLIEDRTGKVFWEKKYEIENGFVNGHLFLESSLPEGTYTLAAYSSTSFTKTPKEFYDFKKISVVKTIKPKTLDSPIEKDSIVQFVTFPEGGKLVSEINSNLAFKAINSKGLPVEVSGTLFEDNTPLLNFKSSHAGMGALSFTPHEAKKYHIQLTEPKLDRIFSIDSIASNGKVLSLISNTKDTLVFKIVQNGAIKKEMVYLRLQLRGTAYYIVNGFLEKESIVKIPLTDVPQGIAEVTLFNEKGLPIAERLVYIKEEQKLFIKTDLDKNNYTTREKVILKIKSTDQNHQPVVAHLGLSIYDVIFQNKQDPKNIQTHYLLSTQLKGTIYNPTYYFNEQNKDRKKALDLQMLTQGWRAYVWNEVNLQKLESKLTPIVFDEQKGKIQLVNGNKKKTSSSDNKRVIMAFDWQEKNETDLIMTDSTGAFTINANHLKIGEGDCTYLKLLAPAKTKYKITYTDHSFEIINDTRKTKNTIYPLPEIKKIKPKEISSFIERNSINKLKEVLITSKKKFRNKYIGKLDSIAKLGDYVCRYNFLNCSAHPFEPDNIKPMEGTTYLIEEFDARGKPKTTMYHHDSYTEAQLLNKFNIALIEGFYEKKVFYEPVYDNITINDPLPDYRNTLFWKPDIITDEQGEATVTFFCSDLNSLFIGNIEGVGGDGLLGTENFQFKVNKMVN